MSNRNQQQSKGIRLFFSRLFGRRNKINVFDVFTPTTQAKVNAVDRPDVERKLKIALRTPGTQIVVFGESGSGKSTLLQKQLAAMSRSYVTTRCTASSSFSSILYSAFDELDQWVATQRSEKNQSETIGELSLEIGEIKASRSRHNSSSEDVTFAPIVGPQLTPQKLGQLFGAAGKAWVIEDFHKVPNSEKEALAQTLKVFSDLAVDHKLLRIIVIGATDSAKEVVEYDPEMNTRVAEVFVPPLDESELALLLENGGRLLNVSFAKVASELITHSVGVASAAHQLALNCMLHMNIETYVDSQKHVMPEDLEEAASQYVQLSSATLKERFDKAVKRERVRQYDNGRLIIAALAALPKEGATHAQLLAQIRITEPTYPPGNVTQNTKALTTEAKGGLITKTPEGLYRFVEPLFNTYARLAFLAPSSQSASDLFASDVLRILGSELEALRDIHFTARPHDS